MVVEATENDYSDIIEIAGVSDSDIAEAVKEYERRQEEAKKAKENKSALFPRIASILGVSESLVEQHVDLIDISTDQIKQASLFSDEQVASYVGDEKILDGVGFLTDEDDYIDDKLNYDDPYKDSGVVAKMAVVWNFVRRKIEDNKLAAKSATKFKITDGDLEDVRAMSDVQKLHVALFAYRLRLTNSMSANHMWKGPFDKALKSIVDVALDNVVSADVFASPHNSLAGKTFDEKLWWVHRGLVGFKSGRDNEELHRSILKIFSDFSVSDEDIEWIINNVSIENSADEINSQVMSVLAESFASGEYSSPLDYPGAIVDLMWITYGGVMSQPAEGGFLPRSVRDKIGKGLMKGLASLAVSFGGHMPELHNEGTQSVLAKVERKFAVNDWQSISERFYRAYYDLIDDENNDYDKVVEERAEIRSNWLDNGGAEKVLEETNTIVEEYEQRKSEEDESVEPVDLDEVTEEMASQSDDSNTSTASQSNEKAEEEHPLVDSIEADDVKEYIEKLRAALDQLGYKVEGINAETENDVQAENIDNASDIEEAKSIAGKALEEHLDKLNSWSLDRGMEQGILDELNSGDLEGEELLEAYLDEMLAEAAEEERWLNS